MDSDSTTARILYAICILFDYFPNDLISMHVLHGHAARILRASDNFHRSIPIHLQSKRNQVPVLQDEHMLRRQVEQLHTPLNNPLE